MFENLLEGVFFLLAFEGRFRCKQDVEDDSTAPNIAFVSEKTSDYFRGHITHSSHQLTAFHFGAGQFIGGSKVKQLDLYLFASGLLIDFGIEDNIFEFDVSMYDMQFVEVVDAS